MTGVIATSLASAGVAAPAAADWEPILPGLIVLLPLLGFVVNGILALQSARHSSAALRAGRDWNPFSGTRRPATHTLPTWIGPGVMALAFGLALLNFFGMPADLHDPVVRTYWGWIVTGNLRIDAALQLDQLSMVMTLVVTGVGFLIHVFSVGYMRDDPGYPRYFAYLNLFVFFMLVLVLGSGFGTMFVGWEGVGLCSYLLIGYWFSDREKSDAGKKAFIVNRIGDVGFLLAVFLLFQGFGTLDFVPIFAGAEGTFAAGGVTITAVTLLLMLGAAGKSAQIPLHVWLPDAMAGPTPVSALIHAATMVTAGVYMVARSSVLYALAPTSQAIVAGIGVLTALVAATIALQQYDIKKVLAYSTVSQLGFMFLAAGVGAFTAAIFHLVTHAFFKALLFLGAGAVIHSMHRAAHHGDAHVDAQDMRNMGGLRKYMPVTCAVMWIATLAIAGIWPFAGFFSKDEIIWYTAAWAGAESNPFGTLYAVYWAAALLTALLTAFYMTRLMVMTFHGGKPHRRSGTVPPARSAERDDGAIDRACRTIGVRGLDQRAGGAADVLCGALRGAADGRMAAPLARAGHARRRRDPGRRIRGGCPRGARRGRGGGVGADLHAGRRPDGGRGHAVHGDAQLCARSPGPRPAGRPATRGLQQVVLRRVLRRRCGAAGTRGVALVLEGGRHRGHRRVRELHGQLCSPRRLGDQPLPDRPGQHVRLRAHRGGALRPGRRGLPAMTP